VDLVDPHDRCDPDRFSGSSRPSQVSFRSSVIKLSGLPSAIYALETDLDVSSAEFPFTMTGMTGMPLIEGNRVKIYKSGDEFFPSMLDAIESAEHSVNMEQYIFWDGRVGRRFAEAFAEESASRNPCEAVGGRRRIVHAGRADHEILESGGCHSPGFRPVHW